VSISEDVIVAKFTELIKNATPSIVSTQSGLEISQNGKIFEIPFNIQAISISKSTLTKS
jgi:hypothetical protein